MLGEKPMTQPSDEDYSALSKFFGDGERIKELESQLAHRDKQNAELIKTCRERLGPAGFKVIERCVESEKQNAELIELVKFYRKELLDIKTHNVEPFIGEKWNNYSYEVSKKALALPLPEWIKL